MVMILTLGGNGFSFAPMSMSSRVTGWKMVIVIEIARDMMQAKVIRKSSQYRRLVALQRAYSRAGKKINDSPVSAHIVPWSTFVSRYRSMRVF